MSEEYLVALNKVKVAKDDITILGEVDFKLESGEFVYLIGKTGTGKSSLLKLLYGDIKLKIGEGVVCGYDLKKLKRKEVAYLRRKLGIVFQDFELLMDRTVYQNLLFVLKATGWKDKSKIESRPNSVLWKGRAKADCFQ